MPTAVRVVCAAIEDDGRYLITQRNTNAVFALMWEFPGGRVEPGESDAEALERELNERLGIEARVGALISRTQRAYTHYHLELSLYHCALGPLSPKPLRVHDIAWVRYDDLRTYSFAPADERAIESMLAGILGPH